MLCPVYVCEKVNRVSKIYANYADLHTQGNCEF